jgi:methionyl-tRNA formyltransferase
MKKLFFVGKGSICLSLISVAKSLHEISKIFVIEDMSNGRSEQTLQKTSEIEDTEYLSVANATELSDFILEFATNEDLLVSFDNFLIISKEICDLFERRSANFHPAPLPSYRGVNVISWGLYNKEQEWGYTWHRIAESIDEGGILYQGTFKLSKDLTQTSVATSCLLGGARDFKKILWNLLGKEQEIWGAKEFDLKVRDKYYSFQDQPYLDFANRELKLEELITYLPNTPFEKWRWKVRLPDGRMCNYISFEPHSSQLELELISVDGAEIYCHIIQG